MKPELRTIGEICDVQKGTSITKKKVTDGKIPVIAGGQQPAYFHNVSNRKGQVITVSASGAYAGFVNFFEVPIFASDCTTIQSKDELKAFTKYVYLMIKSRQDEIYSLQTGAGQPHVYAKDLVKIKIPLPSLTVQQQIVAILERAERLKEMRQKANEDTAGIVQSIFYEMFGDPQENPKHWKTTTLLEVSKDKPQYGSGAKAIPYDHNMRYIRITDVDDEGNLRDEPASASEVEGKYLLKKDDLLFARSGATVGKTYLHRGNKGDSIYAGYMIRFRLNENVCNPLFIYAITKTKYYRNWVINTQTQVAQPNINAQQYGAMKIILPPIALQNKFAQLAETVTSTIERQQGVTSEVTDLCDALMQKAFNGGLVS